MATPARKIGPQVAINLDAVERPEDDVKPPFVAVLGGKELTFKDVNELEWDDVAALDSPYDFVDLCLDEADREYLYAAKVEAWKFGELWKAYQRHYGLKQSGPRGRG